MSTTFDAARFGRLWRAHWAERAKSYLWFFGVCIIVYLIMVLLAFSTVGHDAFQHEAQMICFYIGLFVTGAIFAARHFEGLSHKEAALLTLMRPASVFEKILLAFVMVVVFYPLMYTLIYSVCNFPMVKIAQAMAIESARLNPEFNRYDAQDYTLFVPFFSQGDTVDAQNMNHFRIAQGLLMLAWVSIMAFCVGASIYFKRLPILKTVVAGFVLFIAYGIFLAVTGSSPSSLLEHWFTDDNPSVWKTATVIAFWLGTPLLLWVTAFFHLKEREVA